MPFAAIYVPDFPVQAVLRAGIELREQAVAVADGIPPLLNIVAVNERARAAGVEAGMTELQARARLESLQVRRRSPVQENAAHAALLDCACAFSPRVEDTAPDTVLLDLAGLECLFGPAPKIARDLARRASDIGLETNVAVATNPETAIHAARGFAGVTIIPAGKEAERLAPLPVEVLSPTAEMLETLDRWGVRTCRTLAALPKVAVAERLGPKGIGLQKLACGEGGRPLVLAEPPLAFAEAVELEYPVELLEPLAFILNRMLEQLCTRLSARALNTSELRLRMEYEDSPRRHGGTEENEINRGFSRTSPDQNKKTEIRNRKSEIEDISVSPCLRGEYELRLRLPVPMLDAKVFLKLLQLELKAKPPQAPVSKVFLAAEPVQPRFAQGGLFLPTAPEPERLELTLAMIKAVIARAAGKNSRSVPQSPDYPITRSPDEFVGSPEILDTHRPDAFRMQRFVPPDGCPTLFAKRKGGDFSANVAPGSCPAGPVVSTSNSVTALRRFRPPLHIQTEVRDGQPKNMRFGNRKSEIDNIVWAAGPWRTSGDWWRTDAWTREEWDIAVVHDGAAALYRIYRDVATDEWFVEASYD